MSKFARANKNEEPETQWKPSAREANDLSEKLKAFTKREVNGRMQYPFELYCESENLISFGAFGEIQVIYPLGYYKADKINELRKWIDQQEMEKMFLAFPEEREAVEVKRKEWMMSCLEVIERFRTKVRL